MRVGRAAVLVFALASVGCKLKLEATIKGFKPGEADIVIVHIVSVKDADIFCDWCTQITKVPASGETDIEVKIPYNATTKKLVIKGRKGDRTTGEVTVDFETGLPPNLVMNDYGGVSCEPRKCNGSIHLVPAPEFAINSAAPGMLIEVGADKFTVPADGFVTGPVKSLALSPSLDKRLLMDVCTGNRDEKGKIASTTITVTFPDKLKVTTPVSFERGVLQRELTDLLNGVKKGPVVFPWEKAGAAAKGKRSGVYASGGVCYDAGQPGATVADMDVVALSEAKEREGECVYNIVDEKNNASRGTKKGKLTMNDQLATAYDRITGKVLGTKLFMAPKACTPNFKLSSEGSTIEDQSSYVEREQIGAWAATFAK